MFWLISILLFLYCLGIVLLTSAWKGLELKRNGKNNAPISVIIPARNEENGISDLLRDLSEQSVEFDNFEVIVVDDHSSDNTRQCILDFRESNPALNLQYLVSEGKGKKKALETGIAAASHSWILTTDADCRVGTDWIQSYRESVSEEINMICGPVSYEENTTLFARLQSMEFAGLIGMGGAGIALKAPNMCNGANLAFRKEIFMELGGYQDNLHLASGDDEFLMHKIASHKPGSVHFNKSRNSIVSTHPHHSMRDFIQQRKRWASKWNHYSISTPKWMAVFTLLFYLLLVSGFIMAITGYYSWQYLGIQLLVKFIFDFIFIRSVMNFLKKQLNLFIFLLMELLYPFYVIIFGITSKLGTYEWKGRKFT